MRDSNWRECCEHNLPFETFLRWLVVDAVHRQLTRRAGDAPNMPDSFSEDDIIQRCNEATPDLILYNPEEGNKVLKLSNKLVVKFGFMLSEDEARNQAKAHEILDPKIVRVPRVHRYFMDSNKRGYIVMDLMEGEHKDSITESSQIHEMSRILKHFASIKSQKPGPLAGGPSNCFLFGLSESPTFQSIEDMESWFNIRLHDPTAKISFAGMDLVFCHLDLFPRNVLWLENQPPCILDWTSAGFYPRIFERCSQLITQQPEENKVILDECIPESQLAQVDLVIKAWWNSIRSSL